MATAMETRELPAIGERVHTFGTAAGLQVAVVPRPGYRKTYATYATHYGSIDNRFVDPASGETVTVTDGIAHFLEHKMFEKEGGGDFFDDYARLGASANAYTDYTTTTYLFSTTAHVFENLEVLLRQLTRPYFTPANVEKEKGIIEQEIRMYWDMPGDRLHSNLMHALYREHPVRIDIAGTVESIRAITPDDLYRCHRTFYHPSNMRLLVIGDVDPAAVQETVLRHAEAAGPQPPIRRFYPEEPDAVEAERVERRMPVALPLFALGFKDPAAVRAGTDGQAGLRRDLVTGLMWALLLGRTSPLFRSLYEDGLINDRFGAHFSAGPGYATHVLSGETPDPAALEARLTDGLPTVPFTEEDLERKKRRELGEYVSLFQNPENLAYALNELWFRGIDPWSYPDLLAGITLDEVERRRREVLEQAGRAISLILPEGAA
ncbi:MAG: pitrilysin family protein [Firmicutes bacterium]|nr:pitrilysin family protein [Bacillota bacterium]